MSKHAVSVTLDADNLLWLRGPRPGRAWARCSIGWWARRGTRAGCMSRRPHSGADLPRRLAPPEQRSVRRSNL